MYDIAHVYRNGLPGCKDCLIVLLTAVHGFQENDLMIQFSLKLRTSFCVHRKLVILCPAD